MTSPKSEPTMSQAPPKLPPSEQIISPIINPKSYPLIPIRELKLQEEWALGSEEIQAANDERCSLGQTQNSLILGP